MKKFTTNILALLLIISLSFNAFAQDLTKEEKRARRKEVRRFLKNCSTLTANEAFNDVIVFADSIFILDAKNADAFYFKGYAQYAINDTTGAYETIMAGTQSSPLSSRLKILLCNVLIRMKKPEEALLEIDKVLAIKPNLSEALYVKGLALVATNDSTQAITYFEKALENQLFRE